VTKENKIPTDTEPEGEDTQRERIEELLDEGYTPVQVEKE
jgi:acetyl-CoA carboxylase carboxyltransferase component